MKRYYKVYARYWFSSEDVEDSYCDEYQHMGDTFAESEAKAINNVRYRLGYSSQNKPCAVGGKWANGLDWKAEAQ